MYLQYKLDNHMKDKYMTVLMDKQLDKILQTIQ